MKPLALSLLVVAAVASAQTPTRLYGKTRAQALAMGEQKWMDFVSDHPDGNSTQGMVRAMEFFGTAAEDRNNRLLARLPLARRNSLKESRSSLREAGFSLVSCDRELAGGGTIYQLFFPSRASTVELTFHRFLQGKFRPKKVPEGRFDSVRIKWRKAMKQTESVEDKARFDAAVSDAEKKVDRAVAALSRLKPAERDVCLALLIEWLTPETDQIGTR